MYSRSIKMTLFVYLAFAWLASSILSSVVLLVKYPPYTVKVRSSILVLALWYWIAFCGNCYLQSLEACLF